MSAGRIETRFQELAAAGRAGLVIFISAGDPDHETSFDLLSALPGAGADVIELGMPFTDPMADGLAIQESSLRALKAKANMVKTLELVRRFRQKDQTTPLVLMGYYNPIFSMGPDKFCAEAVAAGADGMIIVDLPPEEDAELREPADTHGLRFVRLATPTTDAARLPVVLEHAGGFVYYVSVTGVTGAKSAAATDVAAAVARIRGATALPVAVGFGVNTPDQAAAIARDADAVVVGSAVVRKIKEKLDADGKAAPGLAASVAGFVSELAAAVRSARG